uniref:Uncharacterized protein n=1 Tax=Sinocyclocheilus grahami TaxID=75366 RepID=A0A672L0Y0_SINGR
MPPKCSCKERRRNFYSRCSIVATTTMLWRCCAFHGESETTLFGLPKEDDIRFVISRADLCWSLREYINFALALLTHSL